VESSGGWRARQPLLRLGLVSTIGLVVAVLCVESVGWLGSGSIVRVIAPAVDAIAFATVAGFCWLTSRAHDSLPAPSELLRHTRNALAGGLGVLLAMTVADSFSGQRLGLREELRLPVSIVAVVVAVAFAWVAITFVRREQAAFDAGGLELRVMERRPLERMRMSHGFASGATTAVALTLFAAGLSPYVFAFASLVLVPAVGTWAYADLRTSRFDRRPLPTPRHSRPPTAFRTARFSAIAVLSFVPVGVFWWVWLSVGTWNSVASPSTPGVSGTDLVLIVTVVMGIAAAVTYPFFAIAEALRTPATRARHEQVDLDVEPPETRSADWTIEGVRPSAASTHGIDGWAHAPTVPSPQPPDTRDTAVGSSTTR
jgi:hypothetical protein